MSGEKNLSTLLRVLNPELDPDDYVFCSIPFGSEHVAQIDAWAIIHENEGLSLILKRDEADRHRLQYEMAFRRITLNVHSSLEAVGLTAAVSTRLTELQISTNVVAGFFHDHIFVPAEDAERALRAVAGLSRAQPTN